MIKFTDEQIKAIEKVLLNNVIKPRTTVDQIIAELTKPDIVPNKGEMYYNNAENHMLYTYQNNHSITDITLLTDIEGGRTELVEALKMIVNSTDQWSSNMSAKALDAHRERYPE